VAPPPEEPIVACSGCGGKNPAGSTECDWCGRAFLSKGGRLRLTLWQVLSSVLFLAFIGGVALLAVLNAGRALPPVRVAATTGTPAPSVAPTPAVTPRVTAANAAPSATTAPSAPTVAPTEVPTVEPTPTPQQQQLARIANTSGQGAWVRLQPGPQAPRVRALAEGTRVLLTGNDETVAARPWREIETEDHNIKGWVLGDFIQLVQPTTSSFNRRPDRAVGL
jgi:hypothetical protein